MMGSSHQLPPEVEEALRRGACVVTGNHRSARTLRHSYDQRQSDLGRLTWATPHIYAWEAWTAAQWRQLMVRGGATALLLHATQERVLWRSILAADPDLRAAGQSDALVSLAANAWRLLHSHGHSGPLSGPTDSTEVAAFRRWSALFRARCRQDSLLTAAELEAALEDAVASARLPIPWTSLLLVGFDRRTPAQQHLLDAFTAVGIPVSDYETTAIAACQVFTANETHGELHACANWLRAERARNPAARLAVIVPSLETDRAGLERTLRDVLAPEHHNIEAYREAVPYEFSLGIPLSSTASVAAALDLLAWTSAALPSETISRLLLSRYVAGSSFAAERRARAAFDAARFRHSRLLRPEMSVDDLLASLPSNRVPGGFRRAMHAALRASAPMRDPSHRRYLDWAEHIRVVLDAADWIPDRETSLEFQIRERWDACLDTLASLDFAGQLVAFPPALDDLVRIASDTIFAPESRDAPIQILGPLEAAGSTFDGLWFLRCGDLTFPLPTTVNPLLPWTIRRALRLPGSDAAVDAASAEHLLRRIASSAPHVVFSFAAHGQGGRQRLSAAARSLMPSELDPGPGINLSASASPPRVVLTPIEDRLPLPPPPDIVLQGGAGLLEAQAACAFRAFALHRLSSKPLESAAFGLDARARGNVVHDILERFWKAIKSQQALRALSPDERAIALDQHIHEALSGWNERAELPWDHAYLELEHTRLRSVLLPWLDQELLRAPFEVSLQEHRYAELPVGPLRLSVRVDRLDHTSAGAVLIDYKTGLSRPSQWLGRRPDAPQLPLYSLLPEAQSLDAVAFATIRPGREMRFAGYESRKGVLPRAVKPRADTLAEQQRQWRGVLEDLASAFQAGDARVQPKHFPTTCAYCDQRSLCRLDPNTVVHELEEEMEVEGEHG